MKRELFLIVRNLAALNLTFLLNFTSFSSLQNLQSTLNLKQGLGTAGLGVHCFAFGLGSFILPSLTLKKLGPKWAICVSLLGYLTYTGANFYPSWYTIIPSALIQGTGASIVWTAQGCYLTELAEIYSNWKGSDLQTKQANVTRFFGIFYSVHRTIHIWGNLLSSNILKTETAFNVNNTEHCGTQYCPLYWDQFANLSTSNLRRPPDDQVNLLLGIFFGFTLLSFLTACFLIQPVHLVRKKLLNDEEQKESEEDNWKLVFATFRQIKKRKQIALLPFALYRGMENAFILGEFSRSYVSCTSGIWMVGYVLIAFGVSNVFFCFFSSQFNKKIKPVKIMLSNYALQFGCLIYLYFWDGIPFSYWILYIGAIWWGLCDAVWTTQIQGIHVNLFPQSRAAAIACYKLMEAVGKMTVYFYTIYLCTAYSLIIQAIVITLGAVGIVWIECREDKKVIIEERMSFEEHNEIGKEETI